MHKIHTIRILNPVNNEGMEIGFSSKDSLDAFVKEATEAFPQKTLFSNTSYNKPQGSMFERNVCDSTAEGMKIFMDKAKTTALEKLGNEGQIALGIHSDDDDGIPFD